LPPQFQHLEERCSPSNIFRGASLPHYYTPGVEQHYTPGVNTAQSGVLQLSHCTPLCICLPVIYNSQKLEIIFMKLGMLALQMKNISSDITVGLLARDVTNWQQQATNPLTAVQCGLGD